MSRIFIENLPKNINENELRKRFSEKGEITDIQLKKEKRTAFIGFKESDQASLAVEYFNRTFINTNKISVKIAEAFRVKKNATSNTENEVNESAAAKQKSVFDPFEELKSDSEFQNFLKVQRHIGTDRHIWQDDVVGSTSKDLDDNDENYTNQKDQPKTDTDENANDNQINVGNTKRNKETFAFTVRIKGLPFRIKRRELKDFFKPLKLISLRLVPQAHGLAYASFKTENDLKQALIKHRGFLHGRRLEVVRHQVVASNENKSHPHQEDQSQCEVKNSSKPKWENAPVPEAISDTGRIYVRNLSYTCTEDDLKQLFEKYGVLTELHLPIDSTTKKPKGFAFVTFMFPEHAVQAFNELDKTDFQGRLIHLLPAYNKVETRSSKNGANHMLPAEENADSTSEQSGTLSKQSTFKQNKQEQLKEQASNQNNWNSLFIRPNAVADIMSKQFEVNKLDLLAKGNKTDTVAVRMALGETQIVHEVKQFFLQNNVSLDSFCRGQDCQRSNTIILVKNLPAESNDDEIRQLFSKYGLVNRVLLPPYGVTAIVEMQEPNEAKFAFKKLAYHKYKHHPLYLEWAPSDVFITNDNNNKDNDKDVAPTKLVATDEEVTVKSNYQETPEDDSTIFVKNLNFQTNEQSLRSHFEKIGQIYSTTIATKKAPEGLLSMGYGFVQFYKANSAKEAIKKMQNSQLDGHRLELKLSNRTTANSNVTKTDSNQIRNSRSQSLEEQTGSKICVKNIPFEATVDDIKKIFSVYGQIKSVRLPKKLVGSNSFRGFGFVEFCTNEDAKRAFQLLSQSTHLYGRPLVLEWAKDSSNSAQQHPFANDEVRQVGAKMAHYFDANQNGSSSKRLKKSQFVDQLQRTTGQVTGPVHLDNDAEEEE